MRSSKAPVTYELTQKMKYTQKVQFRPVTSHEVSERGYRHSSTLSSTSALQGLVKTTPRQLYTRERIPVPLV